MTYLYNIINNSKVQVNYKTKICEITLLKCNSYYFRSRF